MPTIKWPQYNREIQVSAGTTVLDAALDNDVPLDHACGGFCACTTCHIRVLAGAENLSKMEDMESERMESLDGRTAESRLGCQTQIFGDVTLEIPTTT